MLLKDNKFILLLKDKIGILVVLAACLAARIFLYSDSPLMWDSSVYVLMGKYIYSLKNKYYYLGSFIYVCNL